MQQTPPEISTVVGDVLHNLRSALDSVAYELAVQSKGELTAREEQVTFFPWCRSPGEYDRFFGIGVDPGKSDEASRLRGRIYSHQARDAMRVVQPFFLWEMAKLSGANLSEKERRQFSEDQLNWPSIHRLRRLSNIDKHRRLAAVGVGWPTIFYWGSDEGDNTRFRLGLMPPTDNTIWCYLVGANAANIELHTEFALVLIDDPKHQPGQDQHCRPQDCQKLLEGFARDVTVTVQQVLLQYGQKRER
jgi:hypothetical protein